MKDKRFTALLVYEEAIEKYDELRSINPGHELLRYVSRQESGISVSPDFGKIFHKRFAPDHRLPLAQFMQARWHGYKIALEIAIEQERKR